MFKCVIEIDRCVKDIYTVDDFQYSFEIKNGTYILDFVNVV
jgi:hypothetical protein